MEIIIIALLPVFLLISLGYFLKFIKFPSIIFWTYADKCTYYLFFPSLLIHKFSTASMENIEGFYFLSSALIALILITIMLILLNKFVLFFNSKVFTSVYQGSIRFNVYILLSILSSIYTDEALLLAALLIMFSIPIVNIACISIFSIYTHKNKINIISFIKSLITNPLIMACIIGGSINYLEINLGDLLLDTLNILGSIALPLGIISVGVGLNFSILKEIKLELFLSIFIKLLLFPIIIFFIAKSMRVDGLALNVLILFASMPTAISSYILAKQLGGDFKLMSAIITMQTLASILTLSVILYLIF